MMFNIWMLSTLFVLPVHLFRFFLMNIHTEFYSNVYTWSHDTWVKFEKNLKSITHSSSVILTLLIWTPCLTRNPGWQRYFSSGNNSETYYFSESVWYVFGGVEPCLQSNTAEEKPTKRRDCMCHHKLHQITFSTQLFSLFFQYRFQEPP